MPKPISLKQQPQICGRAVAGVSDVLNELCTTGERTFRARFEALMQTLVTPVKLGATPLDSIGH